MRQIFVILLMASVFISCNNEINESQVSSIQKLDEPNFTEPLLMVFGEFGPDQDIRFRIEAIYDFAVQEEIIVRLNTDRETSQGFERDFSFFRITRHGEYFSIEVTNLVGGRIIVQYGVIEESEEFTYISRSAGHNIDVGESVRIEFGR